LTGVSSIFFDFRSEIHLKEGTFREIPSSEPHRDTEIPEAVESGDESFRTLGIVSTRNV